MIRGKLQDIYDGIFKREDISQLQRTKRPQIIFKDASYEFDTRFITVQVVISREDLSPQFDKTYLLVSEGVLTEIQHDIDMEINVYKLYLSDKYE